MFRLLSKESNIFSIPVYIAFLLTVFIYLNILDFNTLDVISGIITFLGISLGYFLFNTIALNHYEHLPLFLYTFFVICFYPGDLNLGLAITLLTNSLLLLILTSQDDYLRKSAFVLVGAIIAFNYLAFPYSWPMAVFVLFHIVGTSGRVGLNLIRFFFGFSLILLSYLGVMYTIDYTTYDDRFFPFYFDGFQLIDSVYPLIILSPVLLMIVYAVYDHFKHYNEKSPISRYKYTFVLIFSIAQLLTVFFYMKTNYEYLLLLVLPVTIILSRALHFLPKYWIKEIGLWMIIFSLLAFKFANYFN